MDTAAHWPQEMGLVKPMEEMVQNTCTKPMPTTERRATRPQKEQALNCPRCNSTNTKFCYYNNYSLTQPRYFCKTCRRYWTEGGSLRNVPVGGGSRKNNKRSSSSSSMSSAISSSSLSPPSSKKLHDLNPPSSSSQNPKIDLKLAFQTIDDYHTISEFVELPNSTHEKDNINTFSSTTTPLSALDLLRTGITSRDMNMSSFMPMTMIDTNASYSSGYALHDFKPTLDFGVNGLGGSGYGRLQGGQGSASGRLLFPFEDLKNVSSANGDHNHDFDPMEYQLSGIPVADGITGTEFESCGRHLGWEELRDSNK